MTVHQRNVVLGLLLPPSSVDDLMHRNLGRVQVTNGDCGDGARQAKQRGAKQFDKPFSGRGLQEKRRDRKLYCLRCFII